MVTSQRFYFLSHTDFAVELQSKAYKDLSLVKLWKDIHQWTPGEANFAL